MTALSTIRQAFFEIIKGPLMGVRKWERIAGNCFFEYKLHSNSCFSAYFLVAGHPFYDAVIRKRIHVMQLIAYNSIAIYVLQLASILLFEGMANSL